MKDNQPIIITSTNKDYVLPLCIMLRSLQETLYENIQTTIYVLQRKLPLLTKEFIADSVNHTKVKLVFMEVEDEALSSLKIDGHISIETYYRLLIPDLFPDLDKVIYLDADLIIRCSISELWQLEFDQAFLLAVPHASKESGYAGGSRGLPAHQLIGIDPQTRLFNAGVMVIDLHEWRRNHIAPKIIAYLKKYQQYILWWDQDGLNAILHDQWKPIAPVWNVMTSHLLLFSNYTDSLLNPYEYEAVHQAPAIIHFSGPIKPWMPAYNGPFSNIFQEMMLKVTSVPQEL